MFLLKEIEDHLLHDSDVLVQAGAHIGQELQLFHRWNLKGGAYLFEPNPGVYNKLLNSIQLLPRPHRLECYPWGLSDPEGDGQDAFLNISVENAGESSSLLDPVDHLKKWPQITFKEKQRVYLRSIDSLVKDWVIPSPTILILDTQGYEGRILRGAAKTLETSVRMIETEFASDSCEMYSGCSKLSELDSYLTQFGFIRVATHYQDADWGDAVYHKPAFM